MLPPVLKGVDVCSVYQRLEAACLERRVQAVRKVACSSAREGNEDLSLGISVLNLLRSGPDCHDVSVHWSKKAPGWCADYFGDCKVPSRELLRSKSGQMQQLGRPGERFCDFAAQRLCGVLGTVRGLWRELSAISMQRQSLRCGNVRVWVNSFAYHRAAALLSASP